MIMRTKNKPYCCPRCGYKTQKKCDIARHFFNKKKLCPGQELELELSDDIKDIVLKNRVYQPPKQDTSSVVTNINTYMQNFTNINTFIANIDTIDKLIKYTDYNKIELLTLDQSVEEKFIAKTRRLENDGYKFGFELKRDDLLDIVDQVSNAYKFQTFQDLNIYYDSKVNKLKIFDGEWEEMLTNKGVKKIIETIQNNYWDEYECYLLRKVYCKDGDLFRSQKCKELVEEYYKFIGSFDIEPYSKGKSDDTITSNGSNDYSISEEWYSRYVRIRDNIKKSEINEMKRNVLDIIRKNSARNVEELNKKVFELFSTDEAFKDVLICKKFLQT